VSTSVWFCHALGGGVRVAEPSRVSSEKETPTKKDTTMTFREQLTSQERATSVVSAQTRLSRPALAVYPSSCAGPLLEDPQSPGQRGTRAWRRTPGFGAPPGRAARAMARNAVPSALPGCEAGDSATP